MHRILVDNRRAYEWAASKYPAFAPPAPYHPSLILEKEGDIQAVVVYSDISPVNSNCVMSVAAVPGGRWMTRAYLTRVFEYPFKELNLDRVTAYVSSQNFLSRRFCQHIGFQLEGIVRKAYEGNDLLIYGMLKEECRFVKGLKYGEAKRSRRAKSASNGSGARAGQYADGDSERRA